MSEDAGISPQVQGFIADHIDSVMQLEVLLLLAQSGQARTAAELAGELRVDAAWVDGNLRSLSSLIEIGDAPTPTYRYAPRTPALRDAVAALDEAYAARRVTVIGLIFSKPVDKLRNFADAFRIRKDPTGG